MIQEQTRMKLECRLEIFEQSLKSMIDIQSELLSEFSIIQYLFSSLKNNEISNLH